MSTIKNGWSEQIPICKWIDRGYFVVEKQVKRGGIYDFE